MNDKTGFETAWQHVVDGDSYFRKGGVWYGNAYKEYQMATLYNDLCPELNYKAGVTALYSDNKDKAVEFFRKVMEQKSDLTEDLMFFTGRALQYAGKYDEAVEKFSEYLKSPGKKDEATIATANKYIGECKTAAVVTKDTLRIEITALDLNINTVADEYSEVLSADGSVMYYATRRPLSNSNKYEDAKYDENILCSTLVNNSWGMSRSISKNLTTKYCETPLYLNPTGEELYIYAGYESGGDIKVSVKKKDEWTKPESVSFNINSSGAETSITFSPDNKEVWFVSDDGKEGYGGKDIYMVKRLGEKKWTKPVNAGPMINTIWDEESPRFSKNGDTLFFSSRGHNSIGGFDIFYSVRDTVDMWGKAVNYGFPVNTQWDELFYFPLDPADSIFYFASNRPESRGGLDIFKGKFIPPVPAWQDTVVIKDTVTIMKVERKILEF
jgi:hypothetical protein